MNLPDEVLAVPHLGDQGGRSEFAYRLAWARTYLKNARLITNSERGVWALTPEGSKAGKVDERKLAKEVHEKTRGNRPRRKPSDDTEDERGCEPT